MAKIVDLKSLGILQDVKELKKGKAREAAAVSLIRREGKKKLERIDAPYKASKKETYEVMTTPERKTFTTKEEVNAYKKRLYDAKYEEDRLAKRKPIDTVRKGLTKADTAAGVALERFGALAKSAASQRVISRSVMKKGQMTVQVPEYKAPSVLNDENRFFKGELNKEKRSLYFS